MKTQNQTTQERLQALYDARNNALNNAELFDEINAEIMQIIAEIATYKTLTFLQANNATNTMETTIDQTRGTSQTFGYNMSIKLLKTFHQDIAIFHNSTNSTEIFSDCADLIQEAILAIAPYLAEPVPLAPDEIVTFCMCKNGNERDYTVFQLACKAIRAYISKQGVKKYKKLAYLIGFTDDGEQIVTTKKPKNDISDISNDQKTHFLSHYNLIAFEQIVILDKINGLNTTQSAERNNVSKRTVERALKSAKMKILQVDKRIKI